MSMEDDIAMEIENSRDNGEHRTDPEIWALVLMSPYVTHMDLHRQVMDCWTLTSDDFRTLALYDGITYVKNTTYDRFAAKQEAPSVILSRDTGEEIH